MPAFTSVHPTPGASSAWLCQSVVGGPEGSEIWLRVSVWGSFCNKSAAFPVARLQVWLLLHQHTVLFSITSISDIIPIHVFVSLITPALERWCCILENYRTPESPEVLRMACAEALCVAGVPLSLREHSRAFMSRCDPVTSVGQNMMWADIGEKKITLLVQVDWHWTLLAAGPKPAGQDESGPFHFHAATFEKRRKSQEHLHYAK